MNNIPASTEPDLHGEIVAEFQRGLDSLDRVLLLEIAALAVASMLSLLVSYWLLYRLLPRVFPNVVERVERIGGVSIQGYRILSPARLGRAMVAVLQLVRIVAMGTVLLIVIPLIATVFPKTQPMAKSVAAAVLQPLWVLAGDLLANVDNLVFLIVLGVVTYYAIRLLQKIFEAVGREQIVFRGFDADWAKVTFQLARLVIVALAIVIAFPYIPGSDSAAFRGVTVFVGILMSVGSSTAMGNLVAGAVLVYMRPFSTGDRVKVGDTVGDVIDRDLLVTRIRTIKNHEVTLPNATVLGGHIVNFSASADEPPLILNTSVTLGYEVPWRKIHEVLVAAALETPGVLAEPAPFVLQTALGDFAVAYEINASTDAPNAMAKTYSELHQKMQDHLGAAGIEILSPHYTSLRDGRPSTIPGSPPVEAAEWTQANPSASPGAPSGEEAS